jgi:hypothetical protein
MVVTTTLLTRPWVVMTIVLLCLLFVACISRMGNLAGGERTRSRELLRETRALLEASTHWAAMAEQDSNPVIALMHICYAKAYLRCVRRLLTDAEAQIAHNADTRALEAHMDTAERDTMARIATASPGLLPEGEFAVRSGWLG